MTTYSGDGWILRVGSGLEAWPLVDHVLTDPPYALHTMQRVKTSTKGGQLAALDVGYDALSLEQIEAFASLCADACRRWVVFTMDHETRHVWQAALERAGLDHVRVGVYRRTNAPPQFTGDRPGQNTEAVQIAHAPGRKRWNGGGLHAFWESVQPRGAKQIRAGQKPESLLRTWIEQFTEPGETICDPFTGSGTTGVAAVQLGRRFVGYELDPETAKRAARRIEQAQRQPTLPGIVVPATQLDLIGEPA